MSNTLPDFLTTMIDNPPVAGTGIHAWLFKVARQLHAHLPAGDIVQLLESRVANCGRHVPQNEIVSAVRDALPCAWRKSGQVGYVKTQSRWPAINNAQRETAIQEGGGLADLWEMSRVRIEDSETHTEEIIDQLFPGNPLLCCGKSISEFETKSREEWRGQLSLLSHIVPSPMSKPAGLTKEGKESAHCLDNTGQRRFLVCEFDTGTTDEQAALILHLATFAPLVCALHSGGKSLHGWFYVQDQPEEKVIKFFRYAVSLGADSPGWVRSQFMRMPDGIRDNGKRQAVYFLNFRPLEVQL